MSRRDLVLLLILVSLAFVSRFYRLDFAEGRAVFDETKYYRPAALSYLENRDDPNFEHPPLAKELMALSIRLLGDNPYGWRMPSLISSLMGNVVIYFFIRDLFKSRRVGFLTSIFLSLDFLYFIHARLAVPETIFITFSWISLYFLWRFTTSHKPLNLILGSLFFGLAVSTKWSGLLVLIPFVILLVSRRKFKVLVYSLPTILSVVVVVYLVAYYPYFARHPLPEFWHLQQKMAWRWLYFSQELGIDLSAGLYLLNHAHAWILNPAWAYDFQKVGADRLRLVWAMYHPLLWFSSILLLLKQIFTQGLKDLGRPPGILALFVLSFFVPWLLPARIEYPYYFLSGLPFLYGLTAFQTQSWFYQNRSRFWVFVVTSLLTGLIFYPLLTSWPIPIDWFNILFLSQIKN